MPAAAAKRMLFLAASVLALVAVSVVGPAGGAPPDKDRDAPSVPKNLRVSAVTQTLVSLAWDPSTDNIAVAGYYVRGDQGKATVHTGLDRPEYTLSGLACGQSSNLTVIAFDEAQNRSEKATLTVSSAPCTDTVPPTTPGGFMQVATSDNAVVLAWKPSVDNVGVVGYGVYRNLQRIASPSDPTVPLAGLACGSTYAYSVDAVDAAGNHSLFGKAYVQTGACPSSSPPPPAPTPDTQAPSTPSGLAAASISQTGLTLSWNASTDNVQVTGYDLYRGGAKVASPSAPGASQTGLACGSSYTFAVEARDAAGNRSSRATLTTSTSACSTTTPPPPAPTPDTQAPSTPSGLAAASISQTGLTLSWNASTDNVQVTGYDLYRGGAKVASPSAPGASQTGLACGSSYTFAVEARDAAGNRSSRATLTTSTSACSTTTPPPLDTQPPSTPTGLGVSSATRTSASLSWNPSNDNVAVVGYRSYRDGTYQSTTTQPPTTVSGLSCGTAYTFEVVAFDAVGNASNRASVIGSTLACPDTQAPSAPTGVVASSRTATSIALIWNASTDNVGVVGYGLYRAFAATSSSSSTTGIFTGLTCNTNYTLGVDAYDAAGNGSDVTTVMVSTTACPDTTPPSAPSGVTASNVANTSLTLSWNASTDNTGVTGYDVYKNGALVTKVSSTSSAQSGLTCGTSYTFAVVARDAAGNSSQQAPLRASTSACSAVTPPSTGPITITTGGTYTGNWVSNSSTPAVTIATSQPVTISNSTVTNLAGGVLIDVPGSAQGNVTVDHVRAYGGNGRFVHAEAFKSVTIKNCTIDRTAGIDLRWPGAASNVSIVRNRMHNIQPGPSNSHRQFVQLNEVNSATVDISWNEITNVYGESRVEDTISLYKSSNAQVHDNFIDGGYPLTTDSTHSGMGIIVDGAGGNFNKIYNNQVVSYTNGGVAIAAGHDNSVYGNRIVSDGKTDSGVAFAAANVGVYIRNYASDSAWGNNIAHDNVIGFMHYGNPLYRNDFWLPDCSGNCSNQSLHVGASTKADEDAEVSVWQAKLASAGITLGA